MKKTGIINAPISTVIAGLGHLDQIGIADAGLPIPAGVERIDLALKAGVPGLIETLEVVLSEMEVESVIAAEEIQQHSPAVLTEIKKLLDSTPLIFIPHTEFKKICTDSKAIIRTGEFSPYANLILVSGVIF